MSDKLDPEADSSKKQVKELCWLFNDMTPDGVYYLATKGIIPKPEKPGAPWNQPACVRGYVRHLQLKHSEAGKVAADRKKIADAEIAEKTSMEMDGRLCDRATLVSMLEDMITRGAAEIQRLKNLTAEQKESIFAVLRTVSLPTIEEGEK